LCAVLSRVLWLALNRDQGVQQLPTGWGESRIAAPIRVRSAGGHPETVLQAGAKVAALFAGEVDGFCQWINDCRSAEASPFEHAWLKAELESLREWIWSSSNASRHSLSVWFLSGSETWSKSKIYEPHIAWKKVGIVRADAAGAVASPIRIVRRSEETTEAERAQTTNRSAVDDHLPVKVERSSHRFPYHPLLELPPEYIPRVNDADDLSLLFASSIPFFPSVLSKTDLSGVDWSV